jgi:hypothetical protein
MKTIVLKSKLLLASTFIFSGLMGQDNLKQERVLPEFNSVEITGAENVTIEQGNQNKLIITCDAGNTDDLLSNIEGGNLSFTRKKGNKLKGVQLHIQYVKLNEISLSGASDLRTEGILKTDDLKLKVSGAGDLRLNIEVNNVDSKISGAGDIELSGKATKHKVDISGAGDLKAINLETQTTIANISGSGDAKINAVEEINATISGAGGMFFKNEPKIKNIDVSGAGSYERFNGKTQIKDSTRIKLGDNQLIIVEDDDNDTLSESSSSNTFHHWAGIELGINGLMHNGFDLSPPAGWPELELNYGRSFNWRVNIFEKDFNLYQEKINLITGLGFEWSNYGLIGSYSFTPDVNKLTLVPTTINYRKNRLQSIWIDVPALLEFNTSNNTSKSLHLAFGVVGGYRLGGNLKQVYYVNDKKYRNKVRDDFNLNDYKVSATARLGYGNYTFFGEYNLTGMFKNGQGPFINPITIGVSILPFD